jgi:toxin ParE1/3/4
MLWESNLPNMLSPLRKLLFSISAEQDLEDILLYTLQQWGERQVIYYRTLIWDTLHQILERPNIGHKRSDMSNRHLSVKCGSHVIVYLYDDISVFVVRILHKAMDFRGQLLPDAE